MNTSMFNDYLSLLQETPKIPPHLWAITVYKINDLNCFIEIKPQNWTILVLQGVLWVYNVSAPPLNLICPNEDEVWLIPSHTEGRTTYTCGPRLLQIQQLFYETDNKLIFSQEDFFEWKNNLEDPENIRVRLLIQHYINYLYVEKRVFRLVTEPSTIIDANIKREGYFAKNLSKRYSPIQKKKKTQWWHNKFKI